MSRERKSIGGRHFLVVAPFDPANDDDLFDVEHPDDCPRVDLGAPVEFHPAWYYSCAVSFHLDEGITAYFHHVDDPDADDWTEPVGPGRHAIEAWSSFSPGGPWGGPEWDGGIQLAEDGDSLAGAAVTT
jgi:hypothetical protein